MTTRSALPDGIDSEPTAKPDTSPSVAARESAAARDGLQRRSSKPGTPTKVGKGGGDVELDEQGRVRAESYSFILGKDDEDLTSRDRDGAGRP